MGLTLKSFEEEEEDSIICVGDHCKLRELDKLVRGE
jgi:hypothetical protein